MNMTQSIIPLTDFLWHLKSQSWNPRSILLHSKNPESTTSLWNLKPSTSHLKVIFFMGVFQRTFKNFLIHEFLNFSEIGLIVRMIFPPCLLYGSSKMELELEVQKFRVYLWDWFGEQSCCFMKGENNFF